MPHVITVPIHWFPDAFVRVMSPPNKVNFGQMHHDGLQIPVRLIKYRNIQLPVQQQVKLCRTLMNHVC